MSAAVHPGQRAWHQITGHSRVLAALVSFFLQPFQHPLPPPAAKQPNFKKVCATQQPSAQWGQSVSKQCAAVSVDCLYRPWASCETHTRIVDS